ncbi:MAG: xanthine dehydrogenase family protein subunit M [Bacteroidetes bacterium]|nr:MAG: xanthine dehydrogenase family protein subunit M [Bacteroidota bacterium]
MSTYAFDYARAQSVDEALTLLAGHDGEARLLAGGHSLIPAMKLRLTAPTLLIDVSGLEDLAAVTLDGGHLAIGALTTHRAVETSELVRTHCPALAEAAAGIGDPQVRNRGTIGGSLAHADPAADYPALVLALDAEIEMTSRDGTRTVSADDFFVDMYTTALAAHEMITRVRIPVLGRGEGAAYAKFANPASRYAVVGVAAKVSLADGTCRAARVAVTGAAPKAFRATAVERRLAGRPLTEAVIAEAVRGLADPNELLSDLSGSAEYRAHLCEVMATRALREAAARAA